MKRFFAAAFLLATAFIGAAPAQERDVLWISQSGVLVTPGTKFTMLVHAGDWDKPLRFRVYRISVDDAVAIVRGRPAAKNAPAGSLVWEGTRKPIAGGFWWYRQVAIGPFPIGLYAIDVSSGDATSRLLGNVSTLGVLSAFNAGASGVWAIDLRSFQRHTGPTTIALWSPEKRSTYGCDPQGLAQFQGYPPRETAIVARTADGSADIETPYSTDDTQPHRVQYLQTDRPVYRPGQPVYFRGILRSGFEDSYGIPQGMHRVVVTAPDQSTIYDRRLPLSRLGTLNGTVQLPESAQLGYYSVAIDGDSSASFTVEAYKKPEYLVDATGAPGAVIGGKDAFVTVKALYFFGRPAAGMHVRYSAYGVAQPWGYDPYAFYDFRFRRGNTQLPQISGDATTGSDGTARLRIPTNHADFAYSLPVRIEARDASGRTVETSAAVLVDPAAVVLTLTPRSWFANPGDTVLFDVAAKDLRGKHVASARAHVTVTREVWNARNGRYEEPRAYETDVVTGRDGAGEIAWRPQQPGSYSIVATTRDANGNTSSASAYMWIVGGDDSWMPASDQPILIAEHPQLKRGERARVLVRLPGPGRDVLVAVIADRVTSLHVMHVTGYAASLAVDAPPQASRFTVSVSLPSESGIAQAQTIITRDPQPQGLRIAIKPDRTRYAPGDRATFAVRATDINGKPVRTELALGVVDDAIYAVQSESSEDPLQRFYGDMTWLQTQASWYRPNYVPPPAASEEGVPQGRALKTIARVSSRATGNLVQSGTSADVYSVPGAPAIPLRTHFADTAYWTPAVMTDAAGRALVHFVWPDNLTTWRTTGLGVTADTRIGTAKAESLVTKDFLVRLETPRFLRKGDTTTITAIAHGQNGARDVRLRFTPEVDDPLDAALHLDADDTASTQWTYDAGTALGLRSLTLTGSDGTRTDGVRLPLPVEASGAAEHVRDAGDARSRASVTLPLPAGYDAGDLTATLTPSLTAQLVQNLRLLDVYPYYCTEQTMSAALPAVFVERVVTRMGYELPGDIKPAHVIAHAIARLRELQHPDGSWGWWENDPAHPFMTAYALYGLSQFRAAGYAVPAQMYDRGVDSLVAQLGAQYGDTLRLWGGAQPGSEWNTRAFMLFSLANAAPSRVDRRLLEETRARAASLNSYALAVLGLAYHDLGDDAHARDILARLNARAVTNGAYTYWSGETWHYAWQDDPIETTAYALRLNAALQPGVPIAGRVTAFLRSERRGDWWYTTKDTAAAIYAIAEADSGGPSELTPDETVGVYVDGKLVRSVRITTPILDAAQAEVRVPADTLHDGSIVTFERTGRGALYWSTDFVRYAPPGAHAAADPNRSLLSRLFPKHPPLRVERRYTLLHRGPWRVGDEIRVDLTVTAKDDLQYVAIEDPFPAGVEYAPPQGDAAQTSWSGLQLFDDRAVFFATTLNARWPLHLQYSLRVTTPGTYTAAPPTAYAMYGPPIYAVGDGTRVSVAP